MLGGGAWLSCLGELCVPLVDAWSSRLFELMLIADALQIRCRVAGYDKNLQCKVSVPQKLAMQGVGSPDFHGGHLGHVAFFDTPSGSPGNEPRPGYGRPAHIRS